jgi:hypothetical protein
MDLRDLARIIIRGTGLVIIILAINRVPYELVSLFGTNVMWMPRPLLGLLLLTPAIASIIAGLVLVAYAEKIVSRAFGSKLENELGGSAYLLALEEVAVITLGIYIIAMAISDSAYYLYLSLLNTKDARSAIPQPRDIGVAYVFATRFLVGIVLLLGSRGLVILRHRLTQYRPMKRAD